jgi:bifunctional non-homologous end joining protein LigD
VATGRKQGGARKRLTEYERKRDFTKTPEPSGRASSRRRTAAADTKRAALEFVVQKHAASHLHFDFRLELDGVMKSWAVPKGPSPDPTVRRLAMETEDHPLEYNAFEGIIPQGEYGGGTVMIWDRGRYYADEARPGEDERVLRREYARGKLSITLEGERLRGSWALVRTRGDGRKASWLLLKHRDEHALEGGDLVAEHTTSIVSGRTLEEIAIGRSRVWHSNRKRGRASKGAPGAGTRALPARARRAPAKRKRRDTAAHAGIRPMLAAAARSVPKEEEWRFEPSPGGTRMIAYVTPAAVRLETPRGEDRIAHHPDIARELARLVARKARNVVLDGELVAPRGGAAVFHVFDLLHDDDGPLLAAPYDDRRGRLTRLYARRKQQHVRIVPTFDDAARAARAATRAGWSNIVAKRGDAPYRAGGRGRTWLRLPLPR